MFIKMYGSHLLKKNFLLNEGFDNPVNKICCSSVNAVKCYLGEVNLKSMCQTGFPTNLHVVRRQIAS